MPRLTPYASIICIILLIAAGSALARQPYPYYPYYSGGYPTYSAPAQQPQRYNPYPAQPGQPPAYGAQPASPYAQPPEKSAAKQTPPEVTANFSSRTAYVQQTLILVLEVASDGNLSTLYPELPKNSSLIFKLLDGPTTRSSGEGDQRRIINRFRYAVTPLDSGEITIPKIGVKGKLAEPAGHSSSFEVTTETGIKLQVLPIDPSVQPWLPLQGLVVQSVLKNPGRIEVGEPLTLVTDISVVGATGSQLPSLEKQLKQGDFRVYREKSVITGNISKDGHLLLGQRTETFTLVPLRGGEVKIPRLQITWWNVDTHQKESGNPAMQQLLVGGGSSDENRRWDKRLGNRSSSPPIWLFLIAITAAIGGWWLITWSHSGGFAKEAEQELSAFVFRGFLRIMEFINWLGPIRRLQRLRQLFVGRLPRSFRLWFCIRQVSGEQDPEVWAYMLRFLTHKHLGITTQLPLPKLAMRLVAIHPHADATTLLELMHTLDNALYNGSEIDFTRWKKRFRRELHPLRLRRNRAATAPSRRQEKLPPLNPEITYFS